MHAASIARPAAAVPGPGTSAPDAVRVLVAGDAESRASLVAGLTALGHTVVAAVAAGPEAVAHALESSPDAALLGVPGPDAPGFDAAREIAARLPETAVLLFTGDHTLSLTARAVEETGAVSILAAPAPPNVLDSALRLAVARARALADARREAAAARAALEARKTIERAKGVLMRRAGCGEQEAYRVLQRTSQDRATSMVEVARTVLASEPGAGTGRERQPRVPSA